MMDPEFQSVWPPVYVVKKHRLAKGVKLKASAAHGLVVVVPPRFNIKKIPNILEENKTWITKHLAHLPIAKAKVLPEQIHFPGMNKIWQVRQVHCDAKLELIVKANWEIVLAGNIQFESAQALLKKWVKKMARDFLGTHLDLLSRHTGLSYSRFALRDQQTLWGSCTHEKSINLNYKLIFLSHKVMQYVIIHELCHTRHLNHSQKFWDLVACFDPDWREHKKTLRYAQMPEWLNVN